MTLGASSVKKIVKFLSVIVYLDCHLFLFLFVIKFAVDYYFFFMYSHSSGRLLFIHTDKSQTPRAGPTAASAISRISSLINVSASSSPLFPPPFPSNWQPLSSIQCVMRLLIPRIALIRVFRFPGGKHRGGCAGGSRRACLYY